MLLQRGAHLDGRLTGALTLTRLRWAGRSHLIGVLDVDAGAHLGEALCEAARVCCDLVNMISGKEVVRCHHRDSIACAFGLTISVVDRIEGLFPNHAVEILHLQAIVSKSQKYFMDPIRLADVRIRVSQSALEARFAQSDHQARLVDIALLCECFQSLRRYTLEAKKQMAWDGLVSGLLGSERVLLEFSEGRVMQLSSW